MKGLLAFLRRVNGRHLVEKRLRTALTVAGVAAGVALVTSITVINSTLLSSVREGIRNLAGAAEIEALTNVTPCVPTRHLISNASRAS